MSAFGVVGVIDRTQDWIIAGVIICVAYLVIYPLFIIYLRNKHSRRIKGNLVTSPYKLPINLTPTELAYIFSPKIGKRQMYATLLDLTNRSLLIMEKKDKKTFVSIGPKIDDKLLEFEHLLLDKVKNNEKPLDVETLLQGDDTLDVKGKEKISGSKSYIYWWVQRKSMRDRKIIEKRMTSTYAKMLFKFGVLSGLVLSVVPLVIIRFAQMLDTGEVEISTMVEHACNGLSFWVISLVPICFVSFFLLRFRGRMLGRSWLLTQSFRRYLGQFDAFREYVRLSHKDKLRFESKELKKESVAHTRPYAIACGYVKP